MIQWFSSLTGGLVAFSQEILWAQLDINFSKVWESLLFSTLGNNILTIKSQVFTPVSPKIIPKCYNSQPFLTFLLFFIRFLNLSARLRFKGHSPTQMTQAKRWRAYIYWHRGDGVEEGGAGVSNKWKQYCLMLSWPQTSLSNCILLREEWKSTVWIFVTYITGWILMFCGTCSMTSV